MAPQSERYFKGRGISVPPEVAHLISVRAAEILRQTAPVGRNNSRRLIRATWQRGQIGVHIPPQAIHLVYLDQGIKPFIMKSLEGKTIPIRQPNGTIAFRRAKNVGRPQILSRDERGQIITSKIRWRYPGVEAMNFIQPALAQAISEWLKQLKGPDIMTMMLKQGGEIEKFFSRLKKV